MSILDVSASGSPERTGSIYNRVFWLSYTANFALVTCNAFTFRFAELVAYLGGTEQTAGTIVSTGLFASLSARFVLGQAIDRYGTRRLWILTAVLLVCGAVLFLNTTRIGPVLFLARMAYAIGIAGVATCSIVHVQNQVPPERRTEIIGSLGSSGFLGMVIGTNISDWMFNHLAPGRPQFVALFGASTALASVYLALVLYITWRDKHEAPVETPAAHRLLLKYWPGMVLLVAMTMGMGLTIPTVFLTRYATFLKSQGVAVHGIGVFFLGYTLSAFIFRISGSRWNGTIGRHRMILAGLAGHAVGFALLPWVRNEWHFLPAAVASGFGHAMLFPAVVSIGSGAFPRHYRGTGTTLVLGFLEVGTMLSAPVLGTIIDRFGAHGFGTMFATVSGLSALVAVTYGLTAARRPDVDRHHEAEASAMSVSVFDDDDDEPTDPHDRSAIHQPAAVPFPPVGQNA